MVAQKVAVGVYKGVTTSELDELAAETSASMTATHPDYALVSSPFMSSFLADPFVQTQPDLTSYASSCAAACGKNCCLQPSQEHTQVIQ